MKRVLKVITASILGVAACGDDGSGGGSKAATAGRVVTRTDLVSDESGAMVRDDQLVNAWGLAFNPEGVAWVAAAETGWTLTYDAEGQPVMPPVAIPDPDDEDERGDPTGQVFNGDPEAFEGDQFILVTEDGTVVGWQEALGDEAAMRVDNSGEGAVYKGAAIVETADGLRLLAADFRGRKIDVFDASYAQISGEAFVDPDIPEGFAPFNVELIGDWVLVAYALQDDDGEDDVPGQGNGYVSLFDTEGGFLVRLISQGDLNSPWAAVLTPDTFDAAPERLLIGNFGDGRILVYRLSTSDDEISADFEGMLEDEAGDELVIDGLWALEFGPDAGGFSPDLLYFTAGPDDEDDGVFGFLESGGEASGSDDGSTAGDGPY